MIKLTICPLDVTSANRYVARFHRHHKPVQCAQYAVGICNIDGTTIHGVAIISRPVARMLCDNWTVEVNRCCTDGVANGCSMLLGACKRIARELGYRKIITYTLPEEGGASLRAAGWVCVGEAGGGNWSVPSRFSACAAPQCVKHKWECVLREHVPNINPKHWINHVVVDGDPPTLFDLMPDDHDEEASAE